MTQDDRGDAPSRGVSKLGRAALRHRFLPVGVAVLATALVLPSLKVGWVAEDNFHRIMMVGSTHFRDVLPPPGDMWRFHRGDPEHITRLMDLGLLPWWTSRGMKSEFWRPLTVLTHRLDYLLWPDTPELMHLQSILWFAGLVLAVAVLFRRMMPTAWLAGAAAVLYAADDAHGMPVGFLANRSAILASLFGVCALLAHDGWRRRGRRLGAVATPVLLGVSLLSAEAGIATCAYLAAYALFIDRGTWRRRVVSLVPCAAVAIVWRFAWSRLGYGVAGLAVYVDPVREPLRYVLSVVHRAPLLLLGQWALPPSDVGMMLQPEQLRLLWVLAASFLALLAVMLWPLLRRDRLARFWAAGMLLSVLPVCSVVPQDRNLFFVGLGAMGLLAQFLHGVFSGASWRPNAAPWRGAAVLLACFFVLVHLILAPMSLPLRAARPMGPREVFGQPPIDIPADESLEQQDLIIVNPPSAFHLMFLSVAREVAGGPVPRHVRILAPAFPGVVIRRQDAQTLVIRPDGGYLGWSLNGIFQEAGRPVPVGRVVELTGMTVEVTALTGEGRPAEAAFRFSVPLEDPSLRWLQWKDGEYGPFTVPGVGESVALRSTGVGPFRRMVRGHVPRSLRPRRWFAPERRETPNGPE